MDNQNLKGAKRWISQASVDIRAAKWNLKGGFCEDACFLAQQSAEKALKAFLYFKGERSVVEHSILFLVKRCMAYSSEFKKIIEAAKNLDKYYIPTRYPDSLPEGFARRNSL